MAQNRFAVSGWSLRRKLALAVAIPILLAAVFGGLRVRTELESSANYAASASQVDVLGPALEYLAVAEQAAVSIGYKGKDVDDPNRLDEEQREAEVQKVVAAGAALEEAGRNPDLTQAQRDQVASILNLSSQLRTDIAYVSLGQSTSQIKQLHKGVSGLIADISAAQLEPNAKLQLLGNTIDGRLSLSLEQILLAFGGKQANSAELSAQLGAEAAALKGLSDTLGSDTPTVLTLSQQNGLNFGAVRDGNGEVFFGEEAYSGYDALTQQLLTSIDDDLATEASKARTLAIVNSAVTGAALLAALILVLLVSRWLLNPIRRVREGALLVASEQLPEAVRKIRGGGDPGEIEPIDVTTQEEMGQLARAVDDLHRQAVRLASGEAALRSQVSEMFVTLSRRNTGLVNQQLALIEGLERDEEDPKRLENLFKLDHLASRMRRTAESLMVLADTPVQGGAADTLTVADALHAATAGVADYQRVQILSTPGDRIVPVAAGDVVHMVTELLDNALAYSPPTAPVLVMTTTTITATTVRITDSGLGIDHDAMSNLNNVLKSGGEVNAETARRMGLLVVSRLAKRHGITVSLERTERGGVTATVVIPRNLLRRGDEGDEVEPRKPAPPAAASATPYKTAIGDPAAAPAPAPVPEPVAEVDPIEAAINAVIGLPQRRPGATGAGALGVTPPTPAGSPSLLSRGAGLDRPGADRPGADRPASRPISERPGAERFFLGARKEPLAALESGADNKDDVVAGSVTDVSDETAPDVRDLREVPEGTVEEISLNTIDADPVEEQESEGAQIFALPTRSPFERPVRDEFEDDTSDDEETADEDDVADEPVAEADDLDDDEVAAAADADEPDTSDEPVEVVTAAETSSEEPVADGPAWEPVAQRPAEVEDSEVLEAIALDEPVAAAPTLPTRVPAASILDADTPVEHGDDDSPIFRSLRSNWLSSDGEGEQPWADSEIEAGWEVADRVAESEAPLQRSESGLPMRRPGGRLVPGGVTTPAAKPVVRDPEAIRARLSAHRAGVARGRTASTPSSSNADGDLGSAESTSHDTPQKEAGLV
jgi:signal transduction histidine kinase